MCIVGLAKAAMCAIVQEDHFVFQSPRGYGKQ